MFAKKKLGKLSFIYLARGIKTIHSPFFQIEFLECNLLKNKTQIIDSQLEKISAINSDLATLCWMKFRLECPKYLALELEQFKSPHGDLISFNEFSERYAKIPRAEFYSQNDAQDLYGQKSFELYQRLNDQKIAKELSRTLIPINIKTKLLIQLNLRTLIDIVKVFDVKTSPIFHQFSSIIKKDILLSYCPKIYQKLN